MAFHLVSTKSGKIHFYYTFCFIITVVYFSNIVYNISNAEEDLDDDDEGNYLFALKNYSKNAAFFYLRLTLSYIQTIINLDL